MRSAPQLNYSARLSSNQVCKKQVLNYRHLLTLRMGDILFYIAVLTINNNAHSRCGDHQDHDCSINDRVVTAGFRHGRCRRRRCCYRIKCFQSAIFTLVSPIYIPSVRLLLGRVYLQPNISLLYSVYTVLRLSWCNCRRCNFHQSIL